MVLQNQYSSSLFRTFRPYIIISIAGILAFAPISFMIYALKNDIIVLEYPINYYISQCIHNGEIPYWFNTWGMGFPLQSNLTWGIFSTPQIIFSSVFNYNIYILHIEFMFFLLLSGWSMFCLLKKYILKDENIALLLAIGYMLSGFMVGSTQWLLYITAAAFVPLVISSLLKLLQNPSFKNSFQFAVIYSMMFTSVYAAFNIITTYSLGVFLLLYFLLAKKEKETKRKTIFFVGLGGLLTLILCFPCLYYTLELLNYLDRGNSISSNSAFFNSNYLHPSALSTMLFPFSSVKMHFANTEGTMLDNYTGLFVLLLLPVAIYHSVKEKNKYSLILITTSLLFLMFSFGDITPFRNSLNILPGFSYFRNPAIFRFYFLLALIFFLATTFRNNTFKDLIDSKLIRNTAWLLLAICLIVFFINIKSFEGLSFTSISGLVKNINLSQTLLICSFIQAIILCLFLLFRKTKYFKLALSIFVVDLAINTFLCTPFFSVSSYSVKEVNTILHSTPGFPIQNKKVNEVPTVYTDNKMNNWYNINVFAKEVSTNRSNRGPLTLRDFFQYASDSFNYKLVFAHNDSAMRNLEVRIQRPTHVRASVELSAATDITLLQNYFPGWEAYYNNKPATCIVWGERGMTISAPAGKGVIDFYYEKKGVWISALLLHLITISFLIYCSIGFIKRNFIRPSSLS